MKIGWLYWDEGDTDPTFYKEYRSYLGGKWVQIVYTEVIQY